MSAALPRPASAALPAPVRFALRELRGARRGFGIFLACLAVGVMAIAGIGSFARALTDGLEREGRNILGGDAAFTIVQREATADELGRLSAAGRTSTVVFMRAMARAASGEATLAELKAVDGAWPMTGTAELVPAIPLADALAMRDGVYGAVADETLMARLGVAVGDVIRLGDADVVLRARLATEPDKLATGVGLGARLVIPVAALPGTGLVQPGSLARWSYRVLLDDPSPAALAALDAATHKPLGAAGFEIRTRDSATPQLERNVGRIAQFLTLVALTALVVGGVGVANAVASHLAAKRETIATLKALGASRRTILVTYALEIGAVAGLGIGLGLVLGAALPFAVAAVIGSLIPYPLAPRIDAGSLGLAALYGALVALAFALWPLARAQEARVAALFRDSPGEAKPRVPRAYLAALALPAAGLVAAALATADDLRAALIFLPAAAAVFVVLRLAGRAIMAGAARLPRPRAALPRLALANIHRPGALTQTVVLSLGLGLTLMVAVALLDRSLTHELSGPMAEAAPSFFFVDVPSSRQEEFAGFVADKAPGAQLKSVPMLRGRITALNGMPAEDAKPSPDAAWVLNSDRGLSTAATMPEGSTLAAGSWWDPETKEPLVSFDAKLAAGLGLKLGDTVSVSVLGRTVTARIANLREVRWERLGINFVMLFTPATFAGAPHTVLSTLTFPDGADAARELAFLREVAAAYPAVTTVRVKESIEQAKAMLENLSIGIRAASLVTILSSVLVLAGALAAGHQHRVYDAVILKTLGATRPRLLLAYGMEYAGLGLVTALIALAAGSAAAWAVATYVMEVPFTFSLPAAGGAVAGALALTVGFGLIGTYRALSAPPARVLRHL